MSEKNIEKQVIEYCLKVGKDPLLTQGAGGNISWKDNGTLWIKASGSWLSDAPKKNIFVAVDLYDLQKAIKKGDFSVVPILKKDSLLKPSIETVLHALMPHRIVVHLHAIEILSHLIRDGCQAELNKIINESIRWAIVDYHKPGSGLAAAINSALVQSPLVDVVFLKNHGVVIGGDDISSVHKILNSLTNSLCTAPVKLCDERTPVVPSLFGQRNQYYPLEDRYIQQLAINTNLFNRLRVDWALYPDHVVFLGGTAYIYSSWKEFEEQNKGDSNQPELIFIREEGVFVQSVFNHAKCAQLRCYYDVLSRQNLNCQLEVLNDTQISELLNWDAERYRMSTSK